MLIFCMQKKHQSFLQIGTTIFGGCGQACLDSKSNCKILRRKIFHKRFDGLP